MPVKVILHAVPVPARPILTLLPERPDDVVPGSPRADPAAEHPAEEYRQDDDNEGEQEGLGNGMGRQGVVKENERIEIQKKPHGISQFVVSLRFRLDKEEEQQQGEALNYSSQVLHIHQLSFTEAARHQAFSAVSLPATSRLPSMAGFRKALHSTRGKCP